MAATLPKTRQDVFKECELHTHNQAACVALYELFRQSAKAHNSLIPHCSSQDFKVPITK